MGPGRPCKAVTCMAGCAAHTLDTSSLICRFCPAANGCCATQPNTQAAASPCKFVRFRLMFCQRQPAHTYMVLLQQLRPLPPRTCCYLHKQRPPQLAAGWLCWWAAAAVAEMVQVQVSCACSAADA